MVCFVATQLFQVVGKDQINRFKISIKISFQFQYLQYFQKNLFLHQFSFVNRRETQSIVERFEAELYRISITGQKKRFCWKKIKFCFFPVFFNLKRKALCFLSLCITQMNTLRRSSEWGAGPMTTTGRTTRVRVRVRVCSCVCVCLCEKLQRRHLAPLDLMV